MNTSGFVTVNPSTGEEIETFTFHNAAQTEDVLARADKSFRSFRRLPVYKRSQLFSDLACALRKNKAKLAKVITTEMGKIISEAEAEVEKCAHEADWYAEHGPKMLADEPAPTGAVNAYVSYLPLGPILAVMPWNFPAWQLTRMAIPTILAGNVVLVKHSLNTQRSSLEFERIMLEAGFPEGVFQNLILKRDDVVNVIAAVNAANASQFGLSSNLWTKDIALARKIARDLDTGGVFINGVTASDPRVPVGGVKNSGYGRELSHFGVHAFVNAQTVWIESQ